MKTLLQQDPAMRVLGWKALIIISLFITFISGLGIYLSIAWGDSPEYKTMAPGVFQTLLWLIPGVFHLMPSSANRCNSMVMGLPIPAPKLWLTHLTVLILSQLGILLVVAIILFITNASLDQNTVKTFIPDPGLPLLFLNTVFGMFLFTIILQTQSPHLLAPSSQGRLPMTTGLWLLMLMVLILCQYVPILMVLLPISSILLGIRTYKQIPEVFQLDLQPKSEVSFTNQEQASQEWANQWTDVAVTPLRAHWIQFTTIMASLHCRVGVTHLIFVPFLFGLGMILSSYSPLNMDSGSRLIYIPLTAYMVVVFFMPMATRLYTLEAFPISRNRIFAIMMLPNLLFLGLGFGVGEWMSIGKRQTEELVEYKMRGNYYGVKVPLSQFKIAWEGLPPLNTSPWGESYEPTQVPFFKGSKAVLYSPYSTQKESSKAFVALQISRAVGDFYGETLSPQEIEAHCLTLQSSGQVALKGESLKLHQRFPQLTAPPAPPITPSILALTGLVCAMSLILTMTLFRANITGARRNKRFWVIAGLLLVFHVAFFPLTISGLLKIKVVGALLDILMVHLHQTVPGFNVLHHAFGLILCVLAYFVTQSQFKKVEVLPLREGETPITLTPLLDYFQK